MPDTPRGVDPVRADFSWQAAFAGLLAGFVGFAGSFAVVLQGLRAAGATEEQAASGLLFASIASGLCAIFLSLRTRLPVSVAWSTPGAALLATTGAVDGGFAGAVGAFLMCAAGFVLAGLFSPFGRAVARIPGHLANAMLAGVLLLLCFAPFRAVAELPWLALPILIAWVVGLLINRLWAVPAALAAFALVVALGVALPDSASEKLSSALLPAPTWVSPAFSVNALLSMAVPLFLVTMASQNIAGAAVLSSFGYRTRPGPWIALTGVFSAPAALFGSHAVNLAAITAALCAGEDAHPDPKRRYWAAACMGVSMTGLGLASGLVIAFVALAPSILIEAVAGLALIGPFTGACVAAFRDPEHRESSAVTFLFAASGIGLFGIAGAFWGLLAGAALYAIKLHITTNGAGKA